MASASGWKEESPGLFHDAPMEQLERDRQGIKFSKPELEAHAGSEGRSHVDEVDSLGAGGTLGKS